MLFYYFECPYKFSYKNFLNRASEYERSQLTLPPGEPPPFIPSKTDAMYSTYGCCGPATFQVSPSVIKTCINQYLYIWAKNGTGYWFWFNNADNKQYISGLRWTGSSWLNFRESFSNIQGYYSFNPVRSIR